MLAEPHTTTESAWYSEFFSPWQECCAATELSVDICLILDNSVRGEVDATLPTFLDTATDTIDTRANTAINDTKTVCKGTARRTKDGAFCRLNATGMFLNPNQSTSQGKCVLRRRFVVACEE